ncbi:MAG: arsenate reductase family protein [Myxococcota bacterium]
MAITIYQYPRCGTCRKALKWLEARSVPYEKVDIVENPPSEATLRDIWERSGQPIKKLFNTSGMSYRKGNWKERLKAVSDDEALSALAADGKLIKRPIVVANGSVLIGFKQQEWVETLS